jgi:alkaline phosphatase D
VQVYRNVAFGSLMELFVLDERQYRNSSVCKSGSFSLGCDNLNDPTRTMLGTAQKQWLKNGLANSTRRWKFLLSEVMVQEFLLKDLNHGSSQLLKQLFPEAREASSGVYINLDAWDGYPAERQELLEFISDRSINNVVVCTGDIHNCYAGELRPDFQNLSQPSVGVEVVTGSVSSAGIAELAGGINLTRLGQRVLLRRPQFKCPTKPFRPYSANEFPALRWPSLQSPTASPKSSFS